MTEMGPPLRRTVLLNSLLARNAKHIITKMDTQFNMGCTDRYYSLPKWPIHIPLLPKMSILISTYHNHVFALTAISMNLFNFNSVYVRCKEHYIYLKIISRLWQAEQQHTLDDLR